MTPGEAVHPPGTTTGIPDVDAVIEAVLAGDVQGRRALVRYTTFPCTSEEGLGGPPKCRDAGVADGTPVEYLPILGPGGGQPVLRADVEAGSNLLDVEVRGLYAVWRVPEGASRPDWPAGDYGVIFLSTDELPIVAVHVGGGGIVQYGSGYPIAFYLEHVVGENSWVLPPVGLSEGGS
jgi:hypothetical protein